MNKTKKLAFASVAVVMAGTMAMSMAACGQSSGGGGSSKKRATTLSQTEHNVTSVSADAVDTKTVNGTSFYVKAGTDTLAYRTSTTLNMNICDGTNNDRHISYHSEQISATAVMPDGYTYAVGDLKPAWWQLSQDLGVKFADKAQNRSSDAQINDMVSNNELANYQIVTGSGSAITNNATNMLNLADYLDYMPNYKKFLDENPIVKWSLTTDTATGAMYYAPYFDGNNDIEKYVLTHREWTRVMLDSADVSAAVTTFKASKTGKDNTGSELVYATSYLGQTGSYEVDTTDPSDETRTVKAKIDYDAALAAAGSESTALGTAYKAATGSVYSGISGNIVDIQNAAITATNGEITGAQLIALVRGYIDAAYTIGGNAYETRSDVFNSVSGCWDVDLFTALSRCVVTSYKLFGDSVAALNANQIYAISGRQGTSQRRQDLVSLVGELYGVRGLESRNEFAYVDANGDLKDARNDVSAYDALDRLSDLTKEGLVYTGTENASKYAASSSSVLTFAMHDYSQTQTTDGFYLDVEGFNGTTSIPNGLISSGDLKFDFAPIVTPVSKWDTNSDGTAETYMRFTESWRAVKNTGFCVPKAAVTNPEVLSATLAFIDYLFSNDGQIVATYGPMASANTSSADGFWYGNPVTATIGGVSVTDGVGDLDALKNAGVLDTADGIQYYVTDEYKSQYFTYGNVLYTGTPYLGTQVPTLTTNNLNYYYGLNVNGNYMGEGVQSKKGIGYIGNQAGSYTNYCRGIVGGALPIGNKSQGFEYQATASCGLDGSAIVSTAINNGTIKHLTQTVSSDTYWYTCVPTTLPISSTDGTTLKNQTDLTGSDTVAGLFRNSSKTNFRTNLHIDLLYYGYGSSKSIGESEAFGTIPESGAACIAKANSYGLNTRTSIYAAGWTALKTLYMA